MKGRILMALALTGLTACSAITGGGATFKDYLLPGEPSLKVVQAEGRGSAFVANGSDRPLDAVVVGLIGTVKANTVKGALSCTQQSETYTTCRVSTRLAPNDGLALLFTGSVTRSVLAFSYAGEAEVRVIPGR